VRSLFAQSYASEGKLWPAIHHLQKAAAKAPARLKPGLLDQIGLHFVRLGKRGKACQAFRRALAIKPGHGGASAHLARHCR
jgi:hypothetical protein